MVRNQTAAGSPSNEARTPYEAPVPQYAVSGAQKVRWGIFFRLASPLAALSGFISAVFPPFGILLVLPWSIRRIVTRYRQQQAGPLKRKTGAQLGAFTALLSFFSFLIFFLATISLKRDALIQIFQENAQRNPGPQTQEMVHLISTTEGFIAMMVLTAAIFLATFLLVGLVSGALVAGGPRNRP